MSTELTEIEKSTLYYISGYVAFKEGCSVSAPDVPADNSEFLNYVSRGSLGHPPPDLYDFSQYIYAFFKAREKKWCPQVFLDAYQIIYNSPRGGEGSAMSVKKVLDRGRGVSALW